VKQLKQEFGSVAFSQSGPSGNFEIGSDVGGDYQKLGPSVFAASDYIDLAGLSMDSETIFPQAITVQMTTQPFINGAVGKQLAILDLITSIPIDLTSAYWATGIWLTDGPGFSLSESNFEHVLYARNNTYSTSVDLAASWTMLASTHQFGSMSPTASDRLYCYRIVTFDDDVTAITLPSARHLLVVDVKAEPEFEYLMRLKRSYDLQNEPDVD